MSRYGMTWFAPSRSQVAGTGRRADGQRPSTRWGPRGGGTLTVARDHPGQGPAKLMLPGLKVEIVLKHGGVECVGPAVAEDLSDARVADLCAGGFEPLFDERGDETAILNSRSRVG